MTLDITNNFSAKKELNLTPISPVNTFNTQADNSLSWGNNSSSPQQETKDSVATTSSYNSTNGYGLVNAGTAVSKAAGEAPYANAPKLGGNNWGADLVNAPTAWQHGYTGKGVIVAVLDTGVDYNHQDLKNNIWTNPGEIAGNGKDDDKDGYIDDVHGWNFIDNNDNVLDDNGHGTHVSGTIAAENNGIGVTGIAYNAKIMPVKVLDKNGSGSYDTISKGIYYAVDHGANVINLSLGGNSSNSTLQSAIKYASSKNVIVVMAAGNSSGSTPDYPASYARDYGIAVGAVDKNNQLTNFSNRSGTQEIKYVTAPGQDIYSTIPNNQYATYSGTSMAAPHVAGIVALMLSANHNLTDSQVRDIITGTAENGTKTQDPSQPSTPSPSLPFPFPINLPLSLINIGSIVSQFPFNTIGSLFPIKTQAQSTTPLQPIIVSIGENDLKLQFGDVNSGTPKAEKLNYYSENNDQLALPHYDSNLTNDTMTEDTDIWNLN